MLTQTGLVMCTRLYMCKAIELGTWTRSGTGQEANGVPHQAFLAQFFLFNTQKGRSLLMSSLKLIKATVSTQAIISKQTRLPGYLVEGDGMNHGRRRRAKKPFKTLPEAGCGGACL